MNMWKFSRAALWACLAVGALAGCETSQVNLTYDPSAAKAVPANAAESVEFVSVTDHRKHAANWLGAIRSGFGNPLKTLETPVPVKDMVAKAYEDGLKARGLFASSKAKYGMKVDVSQFDCNQYARREAHIRFDISLIELQSQKSIYDTVVTVDRVTGSVITFDAGIFASVEDLRKLANETLQEAVDKTLDDQKLRDRLS
jgi:uncharacterized lipoprotein YajG